MPTGVRINKNMVEIMESLDKATKPEDIDQIAIAKMLANVKGMQKDVQDFNYHPNALGSKPLPGASPPR